MMKLAVAQAQVILIGQNVRAKVNLACPCTQAFWLEIGQYPGVNSSSEYGMIQSEQIYDRTI